MNKEQAATPYQQSDARFVSLLEELTHIKETYTSRQLKWYRERAPRAKHYFRISSTLIIIFSISIIWNASATQNGTHDMERLRNTKRNP